MMETWCCTAPGEEIWRLACVWASLLAKYSINQVSKGPPLAGAIYPKAPTHISSLFHHSFLVPLPKNDMKLSFIHFLKTEEDFSYLPINKSDLNLGAFTSYVPPWYKKKKIHLFLLPILLRRKYVIGKESRREKGCPLTQLHEGHSHLKE